VLFILAMPFASFAASKPFGVDFPTTPEGNPKSDCEQILQDWDFAEKILLTRNKEHLFLFIDRYGGKRAHPDYRGTMCRVKDMYDEWAVHELFPALGNAAATDDGRYFVNAIGNVACGDEEGIARIAEMEILVFHEEGEPVKAYLLDDILPEWREICMDKKQLDWLARGYSFKKSVSENNTSFTLKTSDGTTHYFNIKNGKKIKEPIEDKKPAK
jgi:hypothetical protein